MTTTFKSSEIAHVWAHKQAPCGKSPGAMSFNGDCFYSYGTVIARHIEHKGKHAVILNDTSYSISTTKHQGAVRRALQGNTVFHVSGLGRGVSLDLSGKELFEYAVKQSADCLVSAAKAKSRKGFYEADAARWLERAKEINAFYGLCRKVDEKTIERLRESSEKARREAESRIQAENEKRKLEQSEAFEAWKRGRILNLEHSGSGYFNPSLFPVAFRVEGDELVSTLGARVPLDEARKALRFVLMRGQAAWHRNGDTFKVGHYQLDAIRPGLDVTAGCHRISWEEIERLQAIL